MMNIHLKTVNVVVMHHLSVPSRIPLWLNLWMKTTSAIPLAVKVMTVCESIPSDHSDSQEAEGDPWSGFKLVGDNIDKSIRPSHQRRGKSLHYFHSYAAKDRVNLLSLSDDEPEVATPDSEVAIPSSDDISTVVDEMRILMTRCL